MTDTEMIELVRQGTRVSNPTALAQIEVAGRRRRRNRRLGATAAAATAVVAAALIIPAALPTSGPIRTPTAWAVERTSPDTITITIKDLRDPNGLQRALRGDGLAATVSYGASPPCNYAPVGFKPGVKAFTQRSAPGAIEVVEIHPSALLPGTNVFIWIGGNAVKDSGQPTVLIQLADRPNPPCTAPGAKPALPQPAPGQSK